VSARSVATERYDPDRHDVAQFSCGHEALDRWLTRYAGQGERRDAARTFVSTAERCTVSGYYTVVAGQLDHGEATAVTRKGLSRHFPIPVAILARLAVDQRYQRQGLAWLTQIERSPNTVEAYARDLRLFWEFLGSRGLAWDRVSVAELGEFAAWARRPAENVVVLSELAARRSAATVNRMLTAVVAFYEFQGRRGSSLARELVVQTRGGRGAYKPFLNGIAKAAPRAVRLPEQQRLPTTLSLEQVAGGGDRRAAALARSVPVRAAREHGDADRAGAGPPPRGCRLLGAADRDRPAPREPRQGAEQGRSARIGAGPGRADAAVV